MQQTVCTGTPANLVATNADSYFWSPATGLNATIGSNVIATPSATTTYTVTGVDASGNSTTATAEITVNAIPVISLNYLQASACNYISGLYTDPLYSDLSVTTDIVYGSNNLHNGTLVDLKLDLYKPATLVNYMRPAIVVMHGGGFLYGNKNDSVPMLLSNYYAQRGFVVYNINYRVGMPSPTQSSVGKAYYRAIQDAKCAIRYIRKTGTNIGVDTSQIFFMGMSAGAMTGLACAYITQSEMPAIADYTALGSLENAGGNSGYSSKLKAVVSVSGGVFDTTGIFNNETEPLYSFHGTNDNTIPYYSGVAFNVVTLYGGYSVNAGATAAGVNSTLHSFVGGGHVPPCNSADMQTILAESNTFIYNNIKWKHGELSCAMITATGATSFAWSPATALSSVASWALTARPFASTNYTVTATSNGCVATETITLKNSVRLKLNTDIDTVANNLKLLAIASGGQAPYAYEWNDGTTGNTIYQAKPGLYVVTVTSAECNEVKNLAVNFPEVVTGTGLMALDITACSAKLLWSPMAECNYQKVRIINMSDSSVIENIISGGAANFNMMELHPFTNYQAEVLAYSWGDTTAGAIVVPLKTKFCETPLQLNAIDIADESATVQWVTGCTAEDYKFKMRPAGSSIWSMITTPLSTLELNGLQPGTTYEYCVRTICIAGSSFSKRSEIKTFMTTGMKSENVSYHVQNGIQVFPNPAGSIFTVQANLPEQVLVTEIQILNSLGQLVYSQKLRTDEGNVNHTVYLDNKLSAGVYELRVKGETDYLKSRIVIR